MDRYMLEINHPSGHEGCVRALDALAKHGSHLVTKAEHGCNDGVHSGWLIIDAESREEAMRIIPPQFREDARVVKLNSWSKEEIERMVKKLDG